MKNLLLLFFLLQGSCVVAQTNDPLVQWVNRDQGLNQLSIRDCAVDNNGFVWIATELGLYRYNWSTVQLVEHPKYKDISKRRIINICKDHESGIIYFNTEGEQKNYSIENSTINQLDDTVGIFMKQNLLLKSDHPMFAGIVKFNNDTQTEYGSYIPQVHDAILTSSYYCIRSAKAVHFVHTNGSYKTLDYPGAKNAVLMKFNEDILIVGKEKIKILKDEKLTNEKVTADKVINDFLNSVVDVEEMYKIFLFNRTYYFNFKNKLYKIQYDAIKHKLYATFLFKNPVDYGTRYTYSEEDDKYICASKDQGIALIKPHGFNIIAGQKNDFYLTDYVVVKKGDKWYNYTGWIYDTKLKKLNSRFINNYDGNPRFLLEYEGDFFYEAKNNEFISLIDLKTKAPFKNDKMLRYLVGFTYLDSSLWLANEKSCAYLNKNKWVFDPIISKAIRSNQYINAISVKGDKLIFATSQGVFLHKPFSDDIKYIKGLENVNARYIKHIDKSKFWVGCYGDGLFLVYNNKAHRVTDKYDDIATPHAIEEDSEGNLWISTNDYLLTVNKQKTIINTLSGIPIESYIFTTSEGLATNEFNGGGTFPSFKDTDGTIGFPSMKGFIWFQPKNVKKNPFSRTILIDKVLVDTKIILPTKTGNYKFDSSAEFISFLIDFGYSGNKKNLTLSYKFEDQETWTDVSDMKIVLPRYKKGIQKLQIRIKTHGFEDKHDVIKVVTLDFEPKYHETYWFWTLVAVLLLSLFLLMFQVGTTIQKKRAVGLQSKIDEKTAQLSQNIFQLENANEQLKISKLQLSEALHEKEILLREIHHRVKNNLQIIMSLLKIQANEGNSKSIEDFLEISESRIQSMSLIHQSLYENGNLGNIIYQDYLEQLVHHLQSAMGQQNDAITFKIEAENIFLEIETAISLGLIINELVTNTLKYAFPNYEAGNVLISIQQLAENEFQMIYSDSGTGYEETNQTVPSFGLELVRMLVKELKGTIVKVPFTGTKYCITIYI